MRVSVGDVRLYVDVDGASLVPDGETMRERPVLLMLHGGPGFDQGAKVRVTFTDARKGARELDLTDAEAERLGGRAVARRGRRPKSASS